MKAILSETVGGPETLVLREIDAPSPGPKQALIAVKAVGVNFPDALIIRDLYQFKPQRPFAPGGEIAGVVEAVGAEVKRLKPGDRVIGFCGWGGMAEKIALDEARCIPYPADIPFDVAAGLLMTYATSHHALKDRAALKPGETLLVLGAAGGVGIAAVELGKAAGATVVAAVSSEEKAAVAKKHGADRTLIYPAGPFDADGRKALAAVFKDAVGPNGANVIYDPVGGDYSEAALRAIAYEGRFLVVGFPAGIPKLPLNLTLLKACQVIGVFWGDFTVRRPRDNAANIMELLGMLRDGTIRPEISSRYPLERAGEAIAELAERRARGKVIVTVG
ncbi:MAG TPA: NADPH:quinone oxidoreductase family protein [Beijerinckiaceae bacterium]|nr:NADPH:quinone oxidoreductase family protein [Beijerinckiaceae bacterium]